MNNRELYLFSQNKILSNEAAKHGDLWDAASKTMTNSGTERYGVSLEGGHTYIIVNNSYGGYGGTRDNRTCYWWDKGGGVANGQLLAADGKTQAAIVTPTGEFHIWVGADPSPYFHIFRFDM